MTTLMGPTISKRPKEILTGCTLQGLQTGSPDKEVGTVERIYGVAPEAQVMGFMRVFQIVKTTGSALYVKAIDTVALGTNTDNMSLGSTDWF